MNRTRSRTVAALLGATLTTTLAGGPASAKPVDSGTFHDEFADVITDFCEPGLTVDFTAVVDGRFLVNTHGRSGLAFVAEHVSVRQVFTNPETGLSVRTTERTLTKDLRISQAGNLLTIVVLATGNSTVYGLDGSQRRLLHSGGTGHHLNCSGASPGGRRGDLRALTGPARAAP